MAATPQNPLVLMSDEHNPKITGYAGHPIISTPALDALAARGIGFTAAYTPSPICVPARASLATGLPVHRHRAWTMPSPMTGGSKVGLMLCDGLRAQVTPGTGCRKNESEGDRGDLGVPVEFSGDSPLERGEFEPSVPGVAAGSLARIGDKV
jgi:hypothetical protein